MSLKSLFENGNVVYESILKDEDFYTILFGENLILAKKSIAQVYEECTQEEKSFINQIMSQSRLTSYAQKKL